MRTRISTALKAFIVVSLLAFILPDVSPADERMDRRNQSISLLKTSHRQFAAGHYDSVLTTLSALRESDPGNQDAFYYTAVTHLVLKDTTQAIAVLTEGITRAPLSSRIKLLRVRLHLTAGEIDAARELLQAVSMFKPNNPEALYLEGLLSLAEGDTSRTLEVWEKALERIQKKQRGRAAR